MTPSVLKLTKNFSQTMAFLYLLHILGTQPWSWLSEQTVVYLKSQQFGGNVIIHLESFFWPAGKCKSNIYPSALFLVSGQLLRQISVTLVFCCSTVFPSFWLTVNMVNINNGTMQKNKKNPKQWLKTSCKTVKLQMWLILSRFNISDTFCSSCNVFTFP